MTEFIGKVSRFGPKRLIIEIPANYREYYKPGEKVKVSDPDTKLPDKYLNQFKKKGISTRGAKK